MSVWTREYLWPRLSLAYAGILIALTLSPESVGKPLYIGSDLYSLIPFRTTFLILKTLDGIIILEQLLGNIVLFIPLGVLLWLRNRSVGVRQVALTGFIVSLLIELTQLGVTLATDVPYRTFDVDDLGLNVLGSILGYYFVRYGSAVQVKWLIKK